MFAIAGALNRRSGQAGGDAVEPKAVDRRDAGVGRPGAVVDGHATEELRAGAREVVRGGGDVGPGVGEALGEGRCAGGKSEHYMALVEMPGALIAFRAATRRNANKF